MTKTNRTRRPMGSEENVSIDSSSRDVESPTKPLLSFEDPAFPNLFFRSVLPKDRQIIQELHEKWFPVRYEVEFYDNLVQGFMCHSNEPLTTILAISKISEEVVGCLVGMFMQTTVLSKRMQRILVSDVYEYKTLFYLMTLGVVPEYRRSGLGSFLIRKCSQIVDREESCGALYLHVITYNAAAIKFYQNLGFSRLDEIEAYYKIKGKSHNCYLYSKDFHGNRSRGHLFRILSSFLLASWVTVQRPFNYFFQWSPSSAQQKRQSIAS